FKHLPRSNRLQARPTSFPVQYRCSKGFAVQARRNRAGRAQRRVGGEPDRAPLRAAGAATVTVGPKAIRTAEPTRITGNWSAYCGGRYTRSHTELKIVVHQVGSNPPRF